jgi:hypothetical protein
MFCDIWVPNEAEVLESNVLRRLTHPDDIEAEMDSRVSLTAITRDNGDSPSSSGWNVTREATWMASNVLIDTFS